MKTVLSFLFFPFGAAWPACFWTEVEQNRIENPYTCTLVTVADAQVLASTTAKDCQTSYTFYF